LDKLVFLGLAFSLPFPGANTELFNFLSSSDEELTYEFSLEESLISIVSFFLGLVAFFFAALAVQGIIAIIIVAIAATVIVAATCTAIVTVAEC
jgi:VIT1/CCC1 family predicted Fe2+/Mn2+ transporter